MDSSFKWDVWNMSNIFLYFPVPANCDSGDKSEVITVTFNDYTYVIDANKLYYILSLIHKLSEYVSDVEDKKQCSAEKWLHSKGLTNEAFLDAISIYKIENKNSKMIKNYTRLLKTAQNFPKIEEMIKNSFQKAFLFDYLLSTKIKFNETVEEKMNLIKNELKNIEDIEKFKNKTEFYKNNIFKILLNNFLFMEKNCLSDYFQIIDNFSFNLVTEFSTDEDFNVCKVAQPKDFVNGKFKLTNISQKECIKEKTLLKLNMTSNKISYFDFDEILKKSFIFTKNRLDFEKNYINSLISNSNITEKIRFVENNEVLKEINGSVKIKEKESYKNNFADTFYFPVEAMNFSLGTDEYLLNYSVFLNLEESNIQKIKSLFFNRKNKLESSFVNFFFGEDNALPMPVNYAKIDYL